MNNIESFRASIANMTASQFLDHFEDICTDLQTKLGILSFAMVIYDESVPCMIKLLRDNDFWRALDKVSGQRLVVFAIRDIIYKNQESTPDHIKNTADSFDHLLSFPFECSNDYQQSYSVVLRSILGTQINKKYPFIVFFRY